MHNLAEIQTELKDIILGKKTSSQFIRPTESISPHERLMVHVTTIFENFIASLRITYPGVWRLIGEDCARSVALAYSHDYSNLTSRARINEFGENFPEFLQVFPSTKHLKYLPDFAHLELLKSKSYAAKKQNAISLKTIQTYFESDIENCRLEFNDSIFFLQSNFPLMDIQELLDNPNLGELNLQKQTCFIIICRVSGRIETLYLDQKKWQFLKSLNNGDSIKIAMNIFTDKELLTEMPIIINLMISKQMIIKIQR